MSHESERRSRPHELKLRVGEEDIDGLGHVNNVVYLSWIQDVATDHWLSVASPEQTAEIVWVVVRHEIDYERPAHLGDEIIARTWVGEATATTWDRHARGKKQRVDLCGNDPRAPRGILGRSAFATCSRQDVACRDALQSPCSRDPRWRAERSWRARPLDTITYTGVLSLRGCFVPSASA